MNTLFWGGELCERSKKRIRNHAESRSESGMNDIELSRCLICERDMG